MYHRREFFQMVAAMGVTALNASGSWADMTDAQAVPSYLKKFAGDYAGDPRRAARNWFAQAHFGLFMHYGLYSQLGRGEWVMYQEKIPVSDYKKLKDTFKPDKFDADFITDLACEAEMSYVNITSRHHDGFCLFETATSDYHSVNSPARRDLIGELAEQCQKKALGLFLYYSLGADWQHPYFYPRKFNAIVQPAYPKPDPSYRWQKDEDFQIYLEYAHGQIRELLTHYGPIAGMWFDPYVGYFGRPDLFKLDETYALVRKLQPQTLISFKQGVTGTEDFAAPERSGHSMEDTMRTRFGEKAAELARKGWEGNRNKHNEICDTLQPRVWGYRKDAQHKNADEVIALLANAFKQNCNLLLNTGPLPDGSIDPTDTATLREVGRRIHAEGWPDTKELS